MNAERREEENGDGCLDGAMFRGMEQQRGSLYVRIFGVKCGSQFYRMKCPWSYSHVALSPDSMGSYSGRKLCDSVTTDQVIWRIFFLFFLEAIFNLNVNAKI